MTATSYCCLDYIWLLCSSVFFLPANPLTRFFLLLACPWNICSIADRPPALCRRYRRQNFLYLTKIELTLLYMGFIAISFLCHWNLVVTLRENVAERSVAKITPFGYPATAFQTKSFLFPEVYSVIDNEITFKLKPK